MSMFSSGKIAARVNSTLYHPGNRGLGNTAPGSWEMRTDAQRPFVIDHAKAGVIDTGIYISHTFGVSMAAELLVAIDTSEGGGGTGAFGQSVWVDTLPSDPRITLLPERGTANAGTSSRRIIEIPELRQPVHSFRLLLTPVEAPTTGELFIRLVRRY